MCPLMNTQRKPGTPPIVYAAACVYGVRAPIHFHSWGSNHVLTVLDDGVGIDAAAPQATSQRS
jgi:hypothetical protein